MDSLGKQKFEPYSLTIRDAAEYFGFAQRTFYDWIRIGRLHRGYHYFKVGRKVVIVREAFIDFIRKEDGSHGCSSQE